MRRHARVMTAALILACAAPAGAQAPAPTTAPSNGARLLAQNYRRSGWHLVGRKWVQAAARVRWTDLVTVALEDGRLDVRAAHSPAAEGLVRSRRTALAEVEGAPVPYFVSAEGRTWAPGRVGPSQHLHVRAPEGFTRPAAPLHPTAVQVLPERTTVTASGVSAAGPVEVSITLDRGTGWVVIAATPIVGDDGAPDPAAVFHATSPHVVKLLTDHPRETRAYLVPVLRQLAGGANPLRPRAGDVYRAFPDIAPDAQTARRVADLVWRMGGTSRTDREQASRELEALGAAGVLVAVRSDAQLPPEAAARVHAFVARHTLYRDRDPADLLRDYHFLEECLRDEDPRVRDAAREALDALGT